MWDLARTEFESPDDASIRTLHLSEERSYALLAWGAIAIGTVLRLLLLAEQRSLWVDEAMLAFNITSRGFASLLGVLDFHQSAPPGFLWIEKLASMPSNGTSETAWRIFPFVSGVAALILIWLVARRMFGSPAAAIVTVVASLSPLFLRYGVELKPYASDALATCLIVAAALPVLREPNLRRGWIRLGVIGLVALFFSHFAIFALAGVGLALCADSRVRSVDGWFRLAALMGVAWIAWFVLEFVLIIGPSAASMQAIGYWDTAYLTFGAADLGDRWRQALHFIFASPIREFAYGWASLAVVLGTFLLGIAALVRRREVAFAVLIAAPIAFTIAASIAGYFPPARRLILFIAPLVLLGYGAALRELFDRMPRRLTLGAALAMAAAMLAWQRPVLAGTDESAYAPLEPSRALIELALASVKSEPLYIFTTAVPAWIHYTTDWRAPDERRVQWIRTVTGTAGDAFWLRPSRGGPVVGEGDGLVGMVRGHVELIGVPPGQPRHAAWEEVDVWNPDPGWADHEARRLRDASKPYGWLLAWHYTGKEMRELLAGMRRACATFVGGTRDANALAYRIRFDPPGCVVREGWPVTR